MAVFRVEKTGDYTVISNHHFKERSMSLKAKGLLSLMLSLPDNWDYSIAGLVTLSKDGKDSVMGALDELETFGYLKRNMMKNEKGQFAGYDYIVYEKPFTENPNTVNPNTEKPNTEKPTQLNTKESNTKKSLNTKQLITKELIDDLFSFSSSNIDIFMETLKAFEEMRNKIKKPLTDKAKELIVKKLSKLSNGNGDIAITILENSIENSWQGVFPLKNENGGAINPKADKAKLDTEYPF